MDILINPKVKGKNQMPKPSEYPLAILMVSNEISPKRNTMLTFKYRINRVAKVYCLKTLFAVKCVG
jgi:hypothetical protein